jgi:hypothetical protein
MKWRAAHGTVGAILSLVAFPAHAHLVETGFGDFYDGIAHVAVTPADLLVVVALALLAGQQGPRAARYAVFTLPSAWLVGEILGAQGAAATTSPLLTTFTFAAIAVLVALNAKLRATAIGVLAVAVGILHGSANAASMIPAGAGTWALLGVVSVILVMTAILSAQVTALPAGWPRITIRVAGSWIAATGMLMFGWLAHSVS